MPHEYERRARYNERMKGTIRILNRSCVLKRGDQLAKNDHVAVIRGHIEDKIFYEFWTVTETKSSGGFVNVACQEGSFNTVLEAGHYVAI